MKISPEVKWLVALAVPVVFVLFLHHFVTGFTVYNDGRGYYMYLRSAVIDQDLNFSNEWDYYNSTLSRFSSVPIAVSVPLEKTPKGYLENIYLIGSAIMWLPFFLVSHAAALLLHAAGLNVAAAGFGVLYEAGIGLASLFYGLLGLFIIYKFCRNWFDKATSVLATVGLWYGTSVFWYHAVEPSMAHMNSLFLVALFAYFWHRTLGRRTLIQWLLLGLLLGLIYLVRQQDILLGLLPAIELMKKMFSRFSFGKLRSAGAEAVAFGVGIVTSLLPQLYVWNRLYGRLFVYSYASTSQYWHWTFPQIVPFFFSLSQGMWRVPMLLIALIGTFVFARRVKGVAWYFLAVVVAEVLLTASWTAWTNGYGFRFLLGTSVFLALGAAEIIRRLRMRFGNKVAVGVILLLVAANFANMLLVMLGEVTTKIPLSEFPRIIAGLFS